jgi:hypothetical protein
MAVPNSFSLPSCVYKGNVEGLSQLAFHRAALILRDCHLPFQRLGYHLARTDIQAWGLLY